MLFGNGLLLNRMNPKPEAAWLRYALGYRILYLGFNLADMGSVSVNGRVNVDPNKN